MDWEICLLFRTGAALAFTGEMKLLLEAIGEAPTEEELFRFMADVDEDGTGEIEFGEFLRAFEKQRPQECGKAVFGCPASNQ